MYLPHLTLLTTASASTRSGNEHDPQKRKKSPQKTRERQKKGVRKLVHDTIPLPPSLPPPHLSLSLSLFIKKKIENKSVTFYSIPFFPSSLLGLTPKCTTLISVITELLELL